jgi:hypothetical protein
MTMDSTRGMTVRDDRGTAIVIALIATILLSSLGVALVLLSNTEGAIASNYRAGSETLYAADAAVERAVQDILLIPRWDDILTGAAKSAFLDGSTTPSLPSGGVADLVAMTSELQAQSDATSPWGPNNPQWVLFASGPLSDLSGTGTIRSSVYVVVWVSDDPSDGDGNPAADSNGVLTVMAQALGMSGTIRSVEVTTARTDSSEVERGQTAQRGQGDLNQRARAAAVELPGAEMTASDMNTSAGGLVVR